jgi:hypothetical protein
MASKLGGLADLSQGTVTVQPAPVVSFDGVAAAFDNLTKSAGGLADTAFGEMSKDAGEQSVTRDASGNLQYAPPSLLSQVTGTAAQYEAAAKSKYLAEAMVDIEPKIAAMKEQYAGDYNGFRTALDQYTGSRLTVTHPDFQQPIREMIDRAGAQAGAEISAAQEQNTLKNSAAAQVTAWSQQFATASAYVRSGQFGGEAFNAAHERMLAIESSIKSNPATAQFVTPELQAKFDSAPANLKGEAVGYSALSIYNKTQDEGRAIKALDDGLNSPALGISDEEANTLRTRFTGEIRTQHALSQQDTQQAQYEVEYRTDDAYKLALTQGPEARQAFMSDQEIRAAYTGKQAPHGEQIIERLNQAGMIFQSTNALRLMGPQQAQAYLAKLDPRNSPAPKPVAGGGPKPGSKAGVNLANNNPGNMRTPDGNGWQSFPTMQAGIDAVGHQIDLYRKRDGLNTITQIVSKYAPSSENDTKAYILDVEKRAGIPANEPLTDDEVSTVRDAMIAHEQGGVTPFKLLAGQRPGQSAPTDYAARANNFVAAQAAYQNIQQQLHSDPASYVIQNVPGISAQLSSKDPATFQSGLRAMITNQKAMGVAVPSVLTNSQKQLILGSFSTPPEGMSKAQNTLNMLNQLQRTYGQYYPQAMGELSKGGKLPADVTGLDWVKGGDPVVANRMSDAVNTGRETLSKLIPDGGNQLKKKVIEGLSDFNSTLKGPGGSDVASQMAQSVMLYAMKLKAEGGSAITVEQAATQAVKDIIGGNFHMADTYRVPANIDPGAIGHGVNVIQRGLAPSNVEPFVGAKGVTFQDRQKASASILKDQGVWLTLPDNSGLYLAWPAQTGYARARTPAGQPIQYSWAQLQAASKAPLSYEELSANADKAQAQVPSHVPGLAGQQ